jgi:hypothetical protein
MGTGLERRECHVYHSHVVPTLRMCLRGVDRDYYILYLHSFFLPFFLSFFRLLNVLENMQKKCCNKVFPFLQTKTVAYVYSSLCVFLHSFSSRISVTLGIGTVFLNSFPL